LATAGLHGTAAYWGALYDSRYVEASGGAAGSVHFDLDLKADIDIDWLPNPDLDVDFDLKFEPRCSPDGSRAEVVLTAENLVTDADFDWWIQLLGASTLCDVVTGCVTGAEHTIENAFKKGFEAIDLPESGGSVPEGYRCLDANAIVDSNEPLTVQLNFRIGGTLAR